ncbi:MAG: hypothetical protein ACOX2G_01835 [Bacillota bacterium]
MTRVKFQKKRRFRIDPNNPYRTRYMVYRLVGLEQGNYRIEVVQYDYVLRNQVAEKRNVTPELDNPVTGQQLVEYMLENAREAGDVTSIYNDWRQGKIPLISENKNVLVKEAIRKRFARNLKKKL